MQGRKVQLLLKDNSAHPVVGQGLSTLSHTEGGHNYKYTTTMTLVTRRTMGAAPLSGQPNYM